ncbi:SprB repeat-containing protein, partial [Mariniphaga anaerophila]
MKKFLLTKQISPILTTKLFGILFMVLFAFQAFAQTNVDTVNTRPEVVFQDLDGLGEPVYIGEIDAPAVPFSAPSLKMLKSGSVLLKSATTTSSELEWPNPGAVHIAKTAEATGTDGKWKINILVEGKNIQSSTDVVLVIDDSGSMGSGSESKMEEAKNAAKNFVTNLLADENSGIRIAVVTINSGAPTSFNDWSGSGIPETDIQFTDNVADLNSAIDNINAGGGTNIQGGFYVARQNLHNYSTADNKAVVLLSDGVPTYSYESTVTVSSAPPTIANCWYTTGWFGSLQYWATWSPTREEFADNYLTVTNSNYQVIDGTGGDFQLTLYTHEESCNPGNGTRNFRFEAGNHGLPAQYEAGLLINQGVDVYTIGFEVEVGGDAENVLTNSQNKGYYPVESGNLNQVYSEIASNIAYAATNAVFTDPMSTNVILESSANPPTWAVAPSSADVVVSKGSINFENMGEVPGNPGDTQWKIVWNIGTVSESGDKMYYYINLADGTDPTLLYDANEKTYMDYTDVNNNPDAHQETPDDFTIPKVSGGKGSIEIFYYRVNEAGNPINSSGTEVPREMAQKLIPETSMFFEYNGNTALDLDQTYTVIPDDKYISGSETFELNCNFSSENITPTSTEPNKTVWFGYQLSTPPVVTNVEYCVGDEATPLTATLAGGHTSAEYQLYFYTSETGGTPQASITPSTDTEEITSYWVAEGTSSECISPVRSEIQVDVKLCCDLDILVESNSPVCAGSDLFLYERGGEAGIISWTWTGPNGFSSNEQSPVVLAADASQNGFYVVEISDGTCTAKDSIEVIVSSDVITMTDCPTDITECADEIINGVQGKYLDWTIPDFSLNCLGIDSESSSFYMGFGLPEVKWTCWNFNHVQRIGNNEGVVNLWQSTGDGGNPYILSPLVFIDPSVDINMEVYAPAGRDFDWMLYLIDTTGTVTHVGTEHIIGDGLTNEYSINIPGSIPKAPYYLKFEFSGNGNNKCLVDNIYFDGILLDGAGCEGGIEFTVTGPTPGFFPVINDSTITYTATYTPSEGTPATESCSFNVTVEGVEASISNVTNTTCGEDNGSVTVEGESSSANPQFEYSLNGGSWIAFEAGNTSATIDQLAAGNYSINIRDISLEGSCEILTPLSASISAIPGPTVTISDFGPYCKDASAVELDGDPAGGIYSGSGVSAEGLFSPANANPGENFIKYVYTDENGCKDSSVIIITVNPLPNVSIEPVGSYCTTDENQQLTASPAGGTFSGTGVTAEGVFSPSTVGVGSYDVSYTYSNPSTGCTNTTQLTIGVENCCSLESAEANITDAIACNEGTATIEITATGGNLPLTYTLDGNSNTTGTFTGIAAGTYTWSVSESIEGCEPITGNIDVTQPNELVASAEVTAEILCFGETATVTLSAQGGTGAYAYTFNGTTNSTGVFENIAAGTDYAWSVTDENSCEDSGYIDVTQPAALEAEANVTAEIKCFDGTATVTLSATGGTGAYVFTFNETTNSTGVFENIAAGTDYAWSVTDENSCEDSGSIDVTQPSLLEAKAEVTAEIKCFDGTATVTLSATGGTGAYVFTFNETTNSTGVFENIAAGTDYAWSVTDENSCEDSGSIDVTQPTLLEANAEVTAEILCFGETATVTLSATGGTDVYAYTFNGTTNSTGVFENIVAGTDYAWSVTDENSCEDSGSIDVTQPTLLEAEANVTAEIKCFDGTATVTLSAQGGTGAYSYTFNGTTNSTGVFENIAAGTDYAWSVKDANNCEDSGSIDVTQPTLLEAKAEVTAEIKCFDGTATVTLSATGGTGVYAYTFNGTTNSTGVFENIVAGTDYAWSVTDENSCEDSGSIDVTQPEDLLCSTEQDSPVTIFGESDGVATVTVSGGVEPYSYLWDNNETTATASQLNAGTHSVTITDGNGCKTSCEVTITEPGQLSCSVVMDSQVVCFG